MSQPQSKMSFELSKLPRPLLYGSAAVLLVVGVGAWYVLNQPTEVIAPIVLTAPITQPEAPITSTSPKPDTATGITVRPSSTGQAVKPVTDLTTEPSRSLEVQPIPFLVTTAPKITPKSGLNTKTVSQNNPGNRPRVAVNPFAPLNSQPKAVQVITPLTTNTNQAPNFTAPTASNNPISALPSVRPAPPVAVSGTGSPLPNLSFQPNNQTAAPTFKPSVTPAVSSGKTAVGQSKTTKVNKVPNAVALAQPQLSAPKISSANDFRPSLNAGPLSVAPSILQEVVRQDIGDPQTSFGTSTIKPDPVSQPPTPLGNPTDPGTTVTPPPSVTPTTPSTALSNFVLTQRLSFVGVIIGPVNTAILDTKEGVVVVPLGGVIPQSQVVLKSVTAEQIVLILGADTITLDRSKK